MMDFAKTFGLFVVTAIAEIIGCYGRKKKGLSVC